MKSRNIITVSSIVLITCMMLSQSCRDKWNEHYKDEPSRAPDIRLANYIRTIAELSKFSQMITLAGYDSILNASQTYTVWAPNNDALQNVDLNDLALVSDIVKNHIARFSNSTAGVQSAYVKMVNGKLIHFFHDDYGFYLGRALITSPDKLTANGIVHIMDNYVPFQSNIWEYIERNNGFDSLKAYINSQHKKVFDINASSAVSIDSLGNRIYDSVFFENNVLFNSIGHLDLEDSIYTAILPDNTAWNEAYNRIKSYFVSNNPSAGAAIQRSYTQYALVHDMVFRHRISNPTAYDSLVSTSGNVFHQPAYLFNGSPANEVSNGLVYVTSKMQYRATDSWFGRIKVEAERSSGRTNSNSNIYLRYSYGSSLNVSNKGYIVVEPTTTSSISKVYVDFPIPYTLSAKYNIYCVFVPGSIVDPNDLLPYRAIFYLITLNNGKVVQTLPMNVTNNVTDPNGITKMLIAEGFKLPYCDLSLDDTGNSSPSIRLRVQNDVGINEPTLSRTMRIDYIVFEPVAE